MKNRPDFRGLPTAWKVNKKRLLFDEMPVKSQLFVLISSTPKSKFIQKSSPFPFPSKIYQRPWCLPKNTCVLPQKNAMVFAQKNNQPAAMLPAPEERS